MKSKVIIIVFCFVMFSCKKENIRDSVLIKNIQPFDEIEVNNSFDIYLTQDTFYSIKIEADSRFLNNVAYSVENNTLKLNNTSHKKWLHPKNNKVKIFITSNMLKFIKVNETSFIRTTNPIITDEFGLVVAGKLNMAELELNCNTFYFWNNHPCGGKISLRGQAQNLKIWNFAIMAVDAKQLNTNYALVENHSQGDCDVKVNNKIEYKATSTGNINLYGTPVEISKTAEYTSTGRLIKH